MNGRAAFIGAALLAALTCASAARATPTVEVKLVVAGHTYTESDPLVAVLTKTTNIDNYLTITLTGTLSPGGEPAITFSTTSVPKTNQTPSTFQVFITAYDLGPPSGLLSFTSSNTYSFTKATAATFTSYYDPTDTPFGTTDLITTNSQTGPGTFSPPPVTTGPVKLTGMYSMTEEFNVTATVKNSLPAFQSTLTTTAMPEPASLALFGSALVGFGFIRKRRAP